MTRRANRKTYWYYVLREQQIPKGQQFIVQNQLLPTPQ